VFLERTTTRRCVARVDSAAGCRCCARRRREAGVVRLSVLTTRSLAVDVRRRSAGCRMSRRIGVLAGGAPGAATALRVGVDGAREPLGSSSSVARRVRWFSCLGIWVRPPYEGRQAKVAPQIRLRLPAGFADRGSQGRYPIDTKKRARAALRYSARADTAGTYRTVSKKVYKRYPSLSTS